MYDVSRYGRWREWIIFFLDVVAEACASAIATTDALLALQKDYRARLAGAGRSANLHILLDLLFRDQIVSIPSVASHLGVTYRSAQLNVEALVRVGILSEVGATSNPKYFIARDIRDIINETPRPHA